MRPTYETSSDRKREAEVAQSIASTWNCDAIAMPKFSVIDYMMVRDGNAVGFVEIRCRTSDYDDVFINDDKLQHMRQCSSLLKMKAIYAVSTPYRIKYIDVSTEPDEEDFVGRKDRGDVHDIAKVWIYKDGNFNIIKKC